VGRRQDYAAKRGLDRIDKGCTATPTATLRIKGNKRNDVAKEKRGPAYSRKGKGKS